MSQEPEGCGLEGIVPATLFGESQHRKDEAKGGDFSGSTPAVKATMGDSSHETFIVNGTACTGRMDEAARVSEMDACSTTEASGTFARLMNLVEKDLGVAKEQMRTLAAEQQALLERHQRGLEDLMYRHQKNLQAVVRFAMTREKDNLASSSSGLSPESCGSAVVAKRTDRFVPRPAQPVKTQHRQRRPISIYQVFSEVSQKPYEKKEELQQLYQGFVEHFEPGTQKRFVKSGKRQLARLVSRLRGKSSVQSFFFTKIISSWAFKKTVATVVLMYCAFVAYRVELSTKTSLRNYDHNALAESTAATLPPLDPKWFVFIDWLFALFFWIDIVLRVLADASEFMIGPKFMRNIVDMATVMAETCLLASQQSVASHMLFRIVPILRVGRMLRSYHHLKRIFLIMIHSVMPLFWALLFLTLTIFCFGVVFQAAVNDLIHRSQPDNPLIAELRPRFGSFHQSLITLFVGVTGGEDWWTLFTLLRDIGPTVGVLFFIYICLLVLGVLNLITGLFVQRTMDEMSMNRDLATEVEREKTLTLASILRTLFEELDEEGTGVITLDQFKQSLASQQLRTFFLSFGLDVNNPEVLFRLFDVDDSDGIEVDEFVYGCTSLRGGAKAVSVEVLLRESRKFYKREARFQRLLGEQMNAVVLVLEHLAPGVLDGRNISFNPNDRFSLSSSETNS
eukprot:TRINITY_DN10128_c0_g3_i2.p1 TRINITY_DN10128_c0_g3~~TRINITY_DN10128_c0_g3_i2.p1  ORF type:complete len:679 (-),score=92.68 TRINITY_DN10128_c0_g3_i2:32-2068(-)